MHETVVKFSSKKEDFHCQLSALLENFRSTFTSTAQSLFFFLQSLPGYLPQGSNHKHPTNINLQVTNNTMVVQSLGLSSHQSDNCVVPSVLSHTVGLAVPFTDTRYML